MLLFCSVAAPQKSPAGKCAVLWFTQGKDMILIYSRWNFSSVIFICDRPRHVSDIGQGNNHSFFISTGIPHSCHNNITIITYMLVQSWCDCVELNGMNCNIVNNICLAKCWINCKKNKKNKKIFQHNCTSFLGTGQIYNTF